MKLVRAGDLPPSEAKARQFTGQADLVHRLNEQRLAGMRVAIATFTEGGRTFWHRHHGEQVLYVLSGKGCIQKDGEEAQSIEPGDVVYVAPGEKHWHGAQLGQNLEHLAVTTGETEWEEEVKGEPQAVAEATGAAGTHEWEHTALAVADLECAIRFYREAFGYEVFVRESGMSKQIGSMIGLPFLVCDLAQLRAPISPHVLELLEFRNVPPGSESHGPTRPGSSHVSFVVRELSTALEAVKRLGGKPLGEIACFPNARRVYCRDPSGTAIELAEFTPVSEVKG